MNKISPWWLIVALSVGLAGAFVYFKFFYTPDATVTRAKRKEYNILTFKIPNSIDMDITGPPIWEAKKALNEIIPCGICRNKAIPLGSFEHDIVNGMTEKPIFPFDKTNWKFWVNKINELDKKVAA